MHGLKTLDTLNAQAVEAARIVAQHPSVPVANTDNPDLRTARNQAGELRVYPVTLAGQGFADAHFPVGARIGGSYVFSADLADHFTALVSGSGLQTAAV